MEKDRRQLMDDDTKLDLRPVSDPGKDRRSRRFYRLACIFLAACCAALVTTLLVARQEMKEKQQEVRGLSVAAEISRQQLDREGEAALLLARMRELRSEQRWRELEEAVRQMLLAYSGTSVFQTVKAEIDVLEGLTRGWPMVKDGLIYFWRPAGPEAGSFASEMQAHPLMARGEARANEDGSLQLDNGAFLVPSLNDLLLSQCMLTSELTVEAVIEPQNLEQSGPARIVSFSTDSGTRNFTLGQSNESLILRLRVSVSGTRGNGHEVTLCRIPEGGPFHVMVSYVPGSLRCYLNGKEVFRSREVQGDFSVWEPHQFLLGDEFKESRDWHGKMYAVAIYGRGLGQSSAAVNYEVVKAQFGL